MIVYWIMSYLIGNLMSAWWVGKWNHIDLRNHRSGNLGARNAGAVIGRGAFFSTFLGDAGKGVLVISGGYYFEFASWIIAVGGLFVILGHLFPFWLKGKGGKGIATFIGVGLSFDPFLFSAFIIGFAVFFPLLRSATLSMFFGYVTYIVLIITTHELTSALPIILAIIFILYRHRFDFQQSISKWDMIRK
jgi:glycerol-3-phosphate acyltransferase PlsY